MTVLKKRRDIVAQSQPSLTRPRLRTESEARLAEVEQRSAACYADAEELADSLNELAAQVEVAPELVNFDEPSAVHHIEHLQRIATRPVGAEQMALPRTTTKP